MPLCMIHQYTSIIYKCPKVHVSYFSFFFCTTIGANGVLSVQALFCGLGLGWTTTTVWLCGLDRLFSGTKPSCRFHFFLLSVSGRAWSCHPWRVAVCTAREDSSKGWSVRVNTERRVRCVWHCSVELRHRTTWWTARNFDDKYTAQEIEVFNVFLGTRPHCFRMDEMCLLASMFGFVYRLRLNFRLFRW